MTIFLSAFAFAGMACVGVASAEGAQNDLNCDDFSSQAEAQAALDRDPSDPNNLDGDGDGIACENGSTGPPQVPVQPRGGVDTGGTGGDTGTGSELVVLGGIGGLVLIGAGAAVTVRRRNQE
ncbi:excalibur calcium-binding domain-containing protein [Prauserella sp. ASG 168]|uniref:Excalibur calcium-binding domain-containing protein n=2 Tax=Prauserella cavernicola TaxID=2800127 RepID=A0A934V5A8_9PSEU|nr:excalibur calcium-binding domain-containing protein [Prauserella cavernicola]